MKYYMKILGFGTPFPLVLSMGNPVKTRVKRLACGKVWRGGSVAVLAMVTGGLAMTGLARQPSLLEEAGPLLAEYWTVAPGTQRPEKLISVELASGEMSVNVHTETKDMALSMVKPKQGDFGDKFSDLASACFAYARGNDLPMVYFTNERLLQQDEPDQLYVIWCQPGDILHRKLITTDDIVASNILKLDPAAYDYEKLQLSAYVTGAHLGEIIGRQSE